MALIVSHNSALEWLRFSPPTLSGIRPYPDALDLASFPIREDRYSALEDSGLFHQKPIHILAPPGATRTKRRGFAAHRLGVGELAPESLYSLADGCFAAGPELCFMQMAGQLSFLGRIVLGFEFCGSYSHFAAMVSGFYARPALCSVQSIGKTIDAFPNFRGASKAGSALRWIRDGSASPMETVETLRLCLPNKHGGEGLPLPEMNVEIPLDPIAQKITGTRSCRVDLAWASQRVGIEYDGGAYHGDQTKDRKRREALAHMGWTIFVCGSEQLQHFGEHERILDLLESVLVRRRGQHRADRQAAEELKDRLLAATRLGRGMRRLLLSPDIPDSMVPEACIRW